MMPRPSRSHCTPAPVTKIDASSANVVRCPIDQATVLSSPGGGIGGGSEPAFSRTNDPVP